MAAQSTLEMPCLGRPFVLGTLYDCRNDSLIPGVTLWGPDTLDTANSKKMESSKFEIVTDDTFNEKTSRFDVSAGLKLSILSGLVKVSGAGEFLYDRTTSGSQARVCLCYTTTSKFEYLNMNQLGRFQYPKVFQEDIATHVVTAVQYGADAVFVFDRQVDSSESIVKVHGEMEAMLNTGIKFAVGGNAKLELSSQGRMGVEKIHCKFYGDFILPKNPTTYQDAIDVYHQTLPDLLGGADHPNHVPKKVWLYPLSKLKSEIQRTICEISAQLINDLQEIVESLHKLEVRINDLISNEVCTHFVHIKGDLEKLKKFIGGYRASTVKRLSTLLPKVRGGGEEEEKLADVIKDNKKSPFSDEQILSWVSGKETEINTLAAYLKEIKKHSIKFAFQPNEMVTLTTDFEIDSILCFDFNVPAGMDAFLQKMEEYLHGETMQSLHESQSPWYRTQGLELRKLFRQFLNFVAINSNQQGNTCTFVVTNGTSESSKIGAMSLIVDGRSTEFEPPDQPDRPQTPDITHNSLKLSWSKPKYGIVSFQCYGVSYCSADSPDQWKIQTSKEEYLVLTELIPGSLYHCKVSANYTAGWGPVSEVCKVRLPPDHPDKPQILDVTHNSLKLHWTKPKHGGSIVSSYTISYCSVSDDQPEQLCTTSHNQEYKVLTNLTPGSLYHFKVIAVSAAGCSPPSEVSEFRLPPDQPRKPHVIITHNNIQVMWERPKLGAHSVQYYIIGYRPNQSDQWSYQPTTDAQESAILSDLAFNTTYYVKVQAVSKTGKGPYSDLSDPIETLLPPPGKPYATNITHNSLQLNWEKPQYDGAESVTYTIFYHSDSNLSETWLPQKSSRNHFQIKGLAPKMTYHFQVRAEVATKFSSVSEVSDPIETLLPILGKPHATKVSYDSFQINWDKPEYEGIIIYYCISYHLLDDSADKWHTMQLSDSDNYSYVFPANSLKSYVFKVIAVTNTDYTLESDVSDVITTKRIPLGVRIRSHCKRISTNNPSVYVLPLHYTMRKENTIAKAVVGEITSVLDTGVPHKVLMLVGATGVGKSTLINGMANYIIGVDWDDDYRFQVVSEETDQTKSQTKCITAYTFHNDKSSPVPYTLTVVDTPGFGDTEGLERDKEIVRQVKDFFSIRGDEGIDQLHGIGFVAPSSQPRVTATQRYVFQSILSVFGKNVADNIFLMVTFCDGGRPFVIDAAKTVGVPFKNYFKFNNSALFACKQIVDIGNYEQAKHEENEFNKSFWQLGKRSFVDFFNNFSKAEARSLQLSREVLQEREQLEVAIEGLQQQIQAGLAKSSELQQEKQVLKQNQTDIITSKNFAFQIKIPKQRVVNLPQGHHVTNCLRCNITCHSDCKIPNNGDKFNCLAMDKQGKQDATCQVCSGKCSWKCHVNNPYKFELYQELETRTFDDLKKKYGSAMASKSQIEAVMEKMKIKLKEINDAVYKKIKEAKQSLQRLQEIALKPDHLTDVEYIDVLIMSEKQECLPGWNERVKTLQKVRKHAEIVHKVTKDEGSKNPFLFDL